MPCDSPTVLMHPFPLLPFKRYYLLLLPISLSSTVQGDLKFVNIGSKIRRNKKIGGGGFGE